MTSSIHAAIFLGKDYTREFAPCPKYRSEAICTEVVRCESTVDSRTEVGDLESVRIEFGNFQLKKAVCGERRRGDQSHEGKSLCLLRLCIVCWKSA